MPLYVDIRINDQVINRINIGRVKGGTKPDSLNTYVVVEDTSDKPVDWESPNAVEFVHRYGDGAEVCVALALKALGYTSGRGGITAPRPSSMSWDGQGWDYYTS